MIRLRRSIERLHQRSRNRDEWMTFVGADENTDGGFGMLESFDEGHLAPRAHGIRQRHQQGDVVTYVREGTLTFVNSLGQAGVVHAGEFHRRTASSELDHRESNGSHSDAAQVFQIGLCSSAVAREPSHEQLRFSVADRRGRLCLVASSDGRGGSLHLPHDALVYSAVLHAGQHLAHELDMSRCAWLHIVEGEVSVGDTLLNTGDGAGATAERAVSLTARVASEILLLDLGARTTAAGARSTHPPIHASS